MGRYSQSIAILNHSLSEKDRLTTLENEKRDKIKKEESEIYDLTTALKILNTVADENTFRTLDFITGVVNKTLGELFKQDSRRIKIEKKMFAGKHAHLNVELTDSDGNVLDFVLQSGTGLQQVISFLFSLCLIKVSGSRCLFIQDELLGGVHSAAREVLTNIIKIFAEDFQFIMVEYGMDKLGKIYSVEKIGKVSKVTSVDGDYDPMAIYQNTGVLADAEGNIYLATDDEDPQ